MAVSVEVKLEETGRTAMLRMTFEGGAGSGINCKVNSTFVFLVLWIAARTVPTISLFSFAIAVSMLSFCAQSTGKATEEKRILAVLGSTKQKRASAYQPLIISLSLSLTPKDTNLGLPLRFTLEFANLSDPAECFPFFHRGHGPKCLFPSGLSRAGLCECQSTCIPACRRCRSRSTAGYWSWWCVRRSPSRVGSGIGRFKSQCSCIFHSTISIIRRGLHLRRTALQQKDRSERQIPVSLKRDASPYSSFGCT